MTTSKTIAGLIGPFFIALSGSLLLNLGLWPAIAETALHNFLLIIIAGGFQVVVGIAIVRFHNFWTSDWSVLITVIGWLAIVGGLARMLFPVGFSRFALRLTETPGVFPLVALVLLGVGVFLSFKGYRQ